MSQFKLFSNVKVLSVLSASCLMLMALPVKMGDHSINIGQSASAQTACDTQIRTVTFTGKTSGSQTGKPNINTNLRSNTTTSAGVLATIPPNTTLTFVAWAYGQSVNDMWTNQPDSRWFRVTYQGKTGWVASAVIYGNPPNSSLTPTCPPTNGSGYYSALTSLSESSWDVQSGDDNQFEPNSPYGGGDQRWKTDDRIEQIYTDLSTSIFGKRIPMSSGYAYDTSYYNAFKKWHAGLDIAASYQTPIKAVIGGSVAWISGSGNGYIFVGINSDDGRQWVYGHLKSQGNLSKGKRVNAGETIGLVGWYSGAPHLHLEVENGHAYGETNGAMTNRTQLLNATVSPLMAYWQWRNR